MGVDRVEVNGGWGRGKVSDPGTPSPSLSLYGFPCVVDGHRLPLFSEPLQTIVPGSRHSLGDRLKRQL